MIRHSRRIFGLAIALSFSATAAHAQGHGKDKDHDKGHGKAAKADRTPERYQDRNGIWRDGRQDVDNRAKVPPGLAKKPGGLPPGQYKKRYAPAEGASVLRDIFVRRGYTVVRTDNAGSSQYVYYRLRDGSVRRAIVSPGTEQLGFSNVPEALLREVLARLY
jgi:hypothetical protein